MILEGLVTTTDATGGPHLAPMGPTVDAAFTKLLLRPFPTSNTYQNLRRHGEGVFHVTDDAKLIALAAVGAVPELPPTFPAEAVCGFVLTECCRAFEFVVKSIDDSRERVHIEAEVVRSHRLRDFLGFHRAKHAVIEAAILATRFHLLTAAEIDAEFKKLRVIVEKTGDSAEFEAMAVLEDRWASFVPLPPGGEGLGVRGTLANPTPIPPPPCPSPPVERGSNPITVRAPSRLHFGLLNVPTADTPTDARLFGGIGLMVADPGVIVRVTPADEWSASGPSAGRALAFAQRFSDETVAHASGSERAFRIDVESCPPEHVGLGVGTQLGLAVAKAIAVAVGQPQLTAVELAARVGRGARSGVGVHGFDGGGLILDAGKRNGEAVSALHSRRILPDGWRVVLACPRGAPRWHGDAERRAFATPTAANAARLRELFDILAGTTDYPTFADALHEYNREAGAVFASSQGGVYSSPPVAALVDRVRALGVPAVGQSSWGPTVFALTPDAERADWLAGQLASSDLDFVTVTRLASTGGGVLVS